MINRPIAPSSPKRNWNPSALFWIVAAVVLLLVILFAFAGGIGAVLLILGLVALLTGLYTLLFRRRSWVGLPHRKSGGVVAAAGLVALIVGVGVGAATAAPRGTVDKATLVSPVQASATPTPTATNPTKSACLTAAETRQYNGQSLVCTMGVSDQRLVWMTESDSKRVVAEKAAADKAAADKAAAEKAAADKTAADKAAADQAAADQAAAQVAAEQAAAQKAAAEQVAAQQAAQQAAAQQAAQPPAQQAPAAPAAPGYVTPGAFCSGGTGLSKTGKPMVCAPAKDGRMRWLGA